MRSHNLPGVDFCVKHKIRLHNIYTVPSSASYTPVPTTKPRHNEVEFPDESLVYPRRAIEVCSGGYGLISMTMRNRTWKRAIQEKYGSKFIMFGPNQSFEKDLMNHPELYSRVRGSKSKLPDYWTVMLIKGDGSTQSMHDSIVLAEILFKDGIHGFLKAATCMDESRDSDCGLS
jgi:hypothetical protein